MSEVSAEMTRRKKTDLDHFKQSLALKLVEAA